MDFDREQAPAIPLRSAATLKRIGAVERQPLALPAQTNQGWSMDFVSDGLDDGRKFRRSLSIVDDYSRECVATEVDTSIPGG
jgi:putative transposase